MQDDTISAPERLESADIDKGAAEVLEWLGTAYGRPSDAELPVEGVENEHSVTSAELTKEVAAELTKEVAAELTKEVAAELTKEVAAELTKEVAAELTKEVAAELTKEVAVELPMQSAVEMLKTALEELPKDAIAEQPSEPAAVLPQNPAAELLNDEAVELLNAVVRSDTIELPAGKPITTKKPAVVEKVLLPLLAIGMSHVKACAAANRSALAALVMVVVASSAFGIVRSQLVTAPTSVTEFVTRAGADADLKAKASEEKVSEAKISEAKVSADRQFEERAVREERDRTAREASEARTALAAEQQARIAAEGKAAQLTSELATEALARASAEKTRAEADAQLDAERKARAEAENAARSVKEELSRMANAVPPAPPAAAASAVQPVAEAQPEPTEAPVPVKAPAPVITDQATLDAAHIDLLEGERLLSRGDVAAARRRFERAASRGLPEGALAAGTTFDPISLARAGIKLPGDRRRARAWYRRAHELAQRQQ